MQQEEIKQALGRQAAQLVEDGMCVGLGSGSTAAYFIRSLIDRVAGGLSIQAVASSSQSAAQARAGGIPLMELDQVHWIDLTVDGADEVDPSNSLIKGRGGALLREKILAYSSRRVVILVDETKLVPYLGSCPLPVEILPFCYPTTLQRLRDKGYVGSLRKHNKELLTTDNGNYLYDLAPRPYFQPLDDHHSIAEIVGVVETGFFCNLPIEVWVGYHDGNIVLKEPA